MLYNFYNSMIATCMKHFLFSILKIYIFVNVVDCSIYHREGE